MKMRTAAVIFTILNIPGLLAIYAGLRQMPKSAPKVFLVQTIFTTKEPSYQAKIAGKIPLLDVLLRSTFL